MVVGKCNQSLWAIFIWVPQVPSLNSAWQWYTNGIQIPVLRNKNSFRIMGLLFPTRFDHFDFVWQNWFENAYEAQENSHRS